MTDSKKEALPPQPAHTRRSDCVECPPLVTNPTTGAEYKRQGLLGSGGFASILVQLYYIFSLVILSVFLDLAKFLSFLIQKRIASTPERL